MPCCHSCFAGPLWPSQVEASMLIWFHLTATERIRVLGVDTPELKGGTEETRAAALKAKEFTAAWLAQGPVTLATCQLDSFGRVLATVTRGDQNLATLLIQAGLGVPR